MMMEASTSGATTSSTGCTASTSCSSGWVAPAHLAPRGDTGPSATTLDALPDELLCLIFSALADFGPCWDEDDPW